MAVVAAPETVEPDYFSFSEDGTFDNEPYSSFAETLRTTSFKRIVFDFF